MKTAHYFKQGKKHWLVISTGPRPVGPRVTVSGKREARAEAKRIGAKPWNF